MQLFKCRGDMEEDPRKQMLDELPRLRRYARMLVRDPARADDLVQECLVRAIAALKSFQPGTNMRAWLFTILRNTLYNETKKARRTVEQVGEPTSAVSGGQEEALTMRDVQRPSTGCRPFKRKLCSWWPWREWNTRMPPPSWEVPVGTVKSRLSRARQDIRAFLETSRKAGGK